MVNKTMGLTVSLKELYLKFVMVVSIIYLVFVPFGNYPIMLKGIKLDVAIGVLLSVLFIPYLRKVLVFPKVYIFSAVVLALFLLITALLSIEPLFSLWRYIITLGYMFLAFVIPAAFHEKIDVFYRWLSISGIAAALSSVILYFFLGFNNNGWGRFTLPAYDPVLHRFVQFSRNAPYVDPNILAFGLLMTVFPLIWFSQSSKRQWLWNLPLAILFCVAVLLTKSRTAIVAFGSSVVIASCLQLTRGLIRGNDKRIISAILVFLLFVGMLAVGAILVPQEFSQFYARLVSAPLDEGRLARMEFAINGWQYSLKTVFFGQGYYYATKTVDPHNLFLEYLYGSGIVGLLAFIQFIMAVVYFIAKSIKKPMARFIADRLLWYILVAGLTYWHTKTFWVPILLINFIVLYSRSQNRGY